MALLEAKTVAEFDTILNDGAGKMLVVHFWADWAPQCQQITDVLDELAKYAQYSNCGFVKIEAEAVPEISQRYNIAAVPTCILLQNNKEVDRVNGANVPELTKKVGKHASAQPAVLPQQDLNTRLKKLINSAPVMLFMKGIPDEPRCGFSRTITGLLAEHNVEYSSFNILADEEVRQGLKTFSNWPTYPQLYVNGELLGGLDIVKELIESGEFHAMVPKKKKLEDRLKELINQEKVMLFMKGSPETPRCGFSKTITQILNETGLKYSTFDILQDEEVRQGLKKFSNWPTYPQLYVKGELIGGLDIVKELLESGELKSTIEGQ